MMSFADCLQLKRDKTSQVLLVPVGMWWSVCESDTPSGSSLAVHTWPTPNDLRLVNEKHVSPSTRYIVLVSLNYVAVVHDNECRYQHTRVYSTLSAETAHQSPEIMYSISASTMINLSLRERLTWQPELITHHSCIVVRVHCVYVKRLSDCESS